MFDTDCASSGGGQLENRRPFYCLKASIPSAGRGGGKNPTSKYGGIFD